MCGIVGYLGNKEKKDFILKGLKELEYRGYDSAGMAVLHSNELNFFKAVGKLENLANATKGYESTGFGACIGHTRWATHGKPTEINAHPHLGEYSCVIHNGIIENYQELKQSLKDTTFASQTDTEVIVHLFEEYAKNLSPFEAFKKLISVLEGSYAILLLTKKAPDMIFFAKQNSPLVVGKNEEGEIFFSSSDAPLISYAKEVFYLEDGDFGYADKNHLYICDNKSCKTPIFKSLNTNVLSAQKDGYDFFMEKEIYEQSVVLKHTLAGRIKNEKVFFEELENLKKDSFNTIHICACGTSYHAAMASEYLFERVSKKPCKIHIASEFRYKEPIFNKNDLFICISQSGETADTLQALKIAKQAGLITIAICNVDNSSIVRMADYTLLTRAGIEKGVASTKAFACQMLVLWLLSLYFCDDKNIIKQDIKAMDKLSDITRVNKKTHDKIHRLSKRYLDGHGFFFIGRDIFYPLALEGALKLKEISYLHAEGYAAGEMKHGPIALADSKLYTIALMPKNMLYDKIKSNVEELSARDSSILSISSLEFELADDFIKTTDVDHYMLEFFEMMVILQLLAFEISLRLGNDVDMPRNLAKSVTVE